MDSVYALVFSRDYKATTDSFHGPTINMYHSNTLIHISR